MWVVRKMFRLLVSQLDVLWERQPNGAEKPRYGWAIALLVLTGVGWFLGSQKSLIWGVHEADVIVSSRPPTPLMAEAEVTVDETESAATQEIPDAAPARSNYALLDSIVAICYDSRPQEYLSAQAARDPKHAHHATFSAILNAIEAYEAKEAAKEEEPSRIVGLYYLADKKTLQIAYRSRVASVGTTLLSVTRDSKKVNVYTASRQNLHAYTYDFLGGGKSKISRLQELLACLLQENASGSPLDKLLVSCHEISDTEHTFTIEVAER